MLNLMPLTLSLFAGSIAICCAILYFIKRNVKSMLIPLRPILLTMMLFLPVLIYSIIGTKLRFHTTHMTTALVAMAVLVLVMYVTHRLRL